MVAEQDGDGQLGHRVGLLDLLELRRLGQRAPDPVADGHHDDGQEERHPPAPAEQRSSGSAATGMKTRVARIRPAWVPLRVKLVKKPRRPSGACSSVSEFAPLCSPAADRPCSTRSTTSRIGAATPIGGVGRQAADQERRGAHQQQGQDQHLLAADPVAEVADDDRADRPGDVGDAERGQRQQRGGRRVGVGEEDRREDQAGGGAVDEEVVVLERAADEAGERGLARDVLTVPSEAVVVLMGVSCEYRRQRSDRAGGGRAVPGAVSGAALRCCARRPGSPAACSPS